ncbi:unnamed protein product [Nezara viridula]|uniref:Ionotropic glutamate receptor C-terminal domain-containing protein n=1 Tax=Nezara viridula TaxID=85310 RepID=A0A9P0HUD3_NEZVI|nr:unnamed protein product [Nezara viridula]
MTIVNKKVMLESEEMKLKIIEAAMSNLQPPSGRIFLNRISNNMPEFVRNNKMYFTSLYKQLGKTKPLTKKKRTNFKIPRTYFDFLMCEDEQFQEIIHVTRKTSKILIERMRGISVDMNCNLELNGLSQNNESIDKMLFLLLWYLRNEDAKMDDAVGMFELGTIENANKLFNQGLVYILKLKSDAGLLWPTAKEFTRSASCIRRRFYFPDVAAVMGHHIFRRKNGQRLMLQTVCNEKHMFVDTCISFDTRSRVVFKQSVVKNKIQDLNNGLVIISEDFNVPKKYKKNIIVPYNDGSDVTLSQKQLYNIMHESVIGILTETFDYLLKRFPKLKSLDRDFTLKESFWFAVTSFTPQGGGEAPKSLSARTLVAAYWLFVVLMLATFTANLAAFLTVERMQSPVQSLKHLARQSRINYTVVKNSDAHNYFRNMKFAEETLYKYWKEITLNSSSDQSQFRVWDYPIKEQYGHILNAIEKAGPVENLQEGLRKVIESEQAEFALIHDLLELKYHVFKNCNLTLIGEPFAEQPYAVAVQQGSHLNEEISRRILDLQRERFFEATASKYWNSTIKSKCDNVDEDEGITLESLGGVFIATLVGLFIALLTLGAEVWYHKKKSKNQVTTKGQMQLQSIIRDEIFTTKEFGHHNFANRKASLLNTKPKVKQITVYPRGQLY